MWAMSSIEAALLSRYRILPRPFHMLSHWILKSRGLAPLYHPFFHQDRVLFVHIPKTAGSSVGKCIFGTDIIGHYPWYFYENADPSCFKDYFKFSIVREPVARFISAWSYLARGGKGAMDTKAWYQLNPDNLEMADFLKKSKNCRKLLRSMHFVPQTSFIFDDFDQLQVDHLCKTETLEKDMDAIFRALGRTCQLTVLNQSNPTELSHESYRSVGQIIHELYERDYRLLSYE
jgi:hypothetical protein